MNNIQDLSNKIGSIQKNKELVLIAIDGVGGSGKTTLAELLHKNLIGSTIIQLDDFYSPKLQKADLERLKNQVLIPLHNNSQANYQIYQWKTDSYSDEHTLLPKGVIIFEGVFSLDKDIRDFYDFKIWIDYPSDLGFKSGINRDIQRDGVDNSDKWKNIWMPLEEEYKNDQQPEKYADYIIDGTKLEL